jgi:SH3-like domain-containing protein
MRSASVVIAFILCACLDLLTSTAKTGAYLSSPKVVDRFIPCNVEAYVVDKDPNGLKVRSGPKKTHKIIGNLPNQENEGIVVHITGSSGEWVRIDHAVEVGGEQDRFVFKGEGWVYAKLLGVEGIAISNGGTNLYREPMEKSRVLIKVPGGDDAVVIRGCRGKWMYVEYRKVRGWAAPQTLCANPLTTCV